MTSTSIRTSSYGDEMEMTPRGKKLFPPVEDTGNPTNKEMLHSTHNSVSKRGGALSAMNAAFFPDDMFNDIRKNVLGTGKKLKVKQDIEMAPLGESMVAAAPTGDPRDISTRLSLSQETSDSDSAKEAGGRNASCGDLDAHLNEA